MLSIKEAGRYAKHLKFLCNHLNNLITNSGNYTTKTETHLRKKVYSEAEDEIVEVKNDRIFDCKVHDLAHLYNKIIEENLKLSCAINAAKSQMTIDWKENGKQLNLDEAVEYNMMLRDFALDTLKTLTTKTSTESKRLDTSFKMNAEGNQTGYRYEVEVVTQIDYDKSVIKDLYKKTLEKTDKISLMIDEARTKQVIDFEPSFSIHDTLEDVIAEYEKTLG